MSEPNETDLIDMLIGQGESHTVDFKKSDILSNPVKIARLMAAFANSTGGRLLIGICDDGTLEGMGFKKEHEEHIMNIARDRCNPPLNPEFSVIKKPEGYIYVVKVLRYRSFPHSVKTNEGGVYPIRVGTTVRDAEPTELALLFEGAKQEIIKTPELELLLIDTTGKASNKIVVQPTFTKIKKIKGAAPASVPDLKFDLLKFAAALSGEKQPPEDLVPIGIEVSNIGDATAYGTKIFLEFPEECKLLEEHDVKGSLPFLSKLKPTKAGLYVNDENPTEADAWIDELGNDLTMRRFDRIYVKFPEKEEEYKIKAYIIQKDFPKKEFEFSIIVKPNIIEKTEYITEEEAKG